MNWTHASDRLPTRDDADEHELCWWVFGVYDAPHLAPWSRYGKTITSFETHDDPQWFPKPVIVPPKRPKP